MHYMFRLYMAIIKYPYCKKYWQNYVNSSKNQLIIILLNAWVMLKEYFECSLLPKHVAKPWLQCDVNTDQTLNVKRSLNFTHKVKVKVKQSHYRPGQALGVPGGWGS